MLKITEIYKSIQGESRFTGLPCIFIRFTGCNLRCSYCDTKYAYYKGREMSIKEIMDKVKHLRCNLVQITGGEPLLQQEINRLISELLAKKYKVLIGTNGTQNISKLDKMVIKLLDIKCPGSKMSDKMCWKNVKYLTKNDEVKFVLSSRKDYIWAKKIIQKYQLTKKTRVCFSPGFQKLKATMLAGWILKDGIDARLGLQLHKYIWCPEAKSA